MLGVAGFILDAAAGNKVTMDNFSMKINEEQTVAICLDNDEPMSALQLDITLPAGVHYVANSITRDEARLDRDTHSIHMVWAIAPTVCSSCLRERITSWGIVELWLILR